MSDELTAMQAERDQVIQAAEQGITALNDALAKAIDQRDRLFAALLGLVGCESKEELQLMEVAVRMSPAPQQDKTDMLNAIHILLEVASYG